MESDDFTDIELNLLLDGIFQRYGYDFRGYNRPLLKRRLARFQKQFRLNNILELLAKVFYNREMMEKLSKFLLIRVTGMFRDPGFYISIRQQVVPLLKTYPSIRIWHAGCSTGEEVYSMTILLLEEGVYERCRIYATDVDESAIEKAYDGIFKLQDMKQYTKNYIQAGGKNSFSKYYSAKSCYVKFARSLIKNVTFAKHSLAVDSSFNEFNLIICRNVLIYFSRELKIRVCSLLDESLCNLGILGLGKRETLRFTSLEPFYTPLDSEEKIYKKRATLQLVER